MTVVTELLFSKADLENPKLKGKIGKEGWCWIGNLQFPSETRSFCYEDVRYNVPHGRYYSYDACDPQKKPLDKEYVDEDKEFIEAIDDIVYSDDIDEPEG